MSIETMISVRKENQVVSHKRVSDHGEVYTARREVNAMLDLVKQETERIDSRFLEPDSRIAIIYSCVKAKHRNRKSEKSGAGGC